MNGQGQKPRPSVRGAVTDALLAQLRQQLHEANQRVERMAGALGFYVEHVKVFFSDEHCTEQAWARAEAVLFEDAGKRAREALGDD